MKRPVMPRVLKGHRHTYRTREFAALAGVTVRTLRYYDRIGLLMPARSPAGYRLYTRGDLEVLREIVALKAIGFPLSTITGLRRGTPADVAVAMRAQRRALEDKARLLNKAIRAVADLERALQEGTHADLAVLRRIREIMEVEHDNDDWQAAFDTLSHVWQTRLPDFSREALIQIGQEWETLAGDVQRALGDDPRGPGGQQLAARCCQLLVRLYGDEVPLSTWVTAGRHVEKWSPSFGDWPGWRFLSSALSAHLEAV
jgi:DNA-binding transcriptional MerR regulator